MPGDVESMDLPGVRCEINRMLNLRLLAPLTRSELQRYDALTHRELLLLAAT